MNNARNHISCKTINLASRKEWSEAVSGIPSTPAHGWEYCRAMALSSGLPTSLFVFEQKDTNERCIIALSQRQKEEGRKDLVTPYGFAGFAGSAKLLASPSLKNAFMDYCASRGYITAYIQQHPFFPLSQETWGKGLETNHEIYKLDLSEDLSALWHNMGKGHKYALKKMRLHIDCQVEADQEIVKAELHRLYATTLERTKAAAVYHFPREALEMLCDSPSTLLIGIRDNEAVQAISLFTCNAEMGDYFLNATSEKGRDFSRHLIWLAIERLKEKNIPALNLGGGVRPDDSLADFKRRFGGEKIAPQVLKFVFLPEIYEDLCDRYAPNSSNSSYFPPYWQ